MTNCSRCCRTLTLKFIGLRRSMRSRCTRVRLVLGSHANHPPQHVLCGWCFPALFNVWNMYCRPNRTEEAAGCRSAFAQGGCSSQVPCVIPRVCVCVCVLRLFCSFVRSLVTCVCLFVAEERWMTQVTPPARPPVLNGHHMRLKRAIDRSVFSTAFLRCM